MSLSNSFVPPWRSSFLFVCFFYNVERRHHLCQPEKISSKETNQLVYHAGSGDEKMCCSVVTFWPHLHARAAIPIFLSCISCLHGRHLGPQSPGVLSFLRIQFDLFMTVELRTIVIYLSAFKFIHVSYFHLHCVTTLLTSPSPRGSVVLRIIYMKAISVIFLTHFDS